MNIYILPAGPEQFPRSYFDGKPISFRPYDGGISYASFWNRFQELCAEKGFSIKSYLDWNSKERKPEDIFLVLNHPGETVFWRLYYALRNLKSGGGFLLERRKFFLENRSFFKRKILMQLEPPVATPYVYNHLDKLVRRRIYDKIFLVIRPAATGAEYFNYFEYGAKNIVSPYFDEPKTKYLTMINSNVRPHEFRNELYGERLKAIKFFSKVPGFDFYGFGWNKPPRHPFYPHYAKYVRSVWRGEVADKLKTMSAYKFGFAFENGIYPGWISEKIFDCMAAGSVPIYYGAPDIERLVPKNCFIDFRQFRNYDDLNRHLLSLDEGKLKTYRKSIKEFLAILPDKSMMEEFTDRVIKSQ